MFTKFSEFIIESNKIKLPDTIQINGIDKPTKNSNGDYISNNIENIYNFYKWFGESKMVDDIERPLVVHHGTSHDFNIFKKSAFGKMGEGIYFTSIIQDINNHTKRYNSNIIISAYLKTEKLIEIENPFSPLPKNNFDSIIAFKGKRGEEIMVLEPNQIKAINNDGSFNIDDLNIYS